MRDNVVGLQQESPSRLLQRQSEARMTIASAINNRRAHERELQDLADARARLQEIQAAETIAADALATFDSQETAALEAWARDPSGPQPMPNTAKRAELESELKKVASSAAGARKAEQRIDADQTSANERIAFWNREIASASVTVMIEVMSPLLDKMAATYADLTAQIALVNEGVAQAHQLAGPLGDSQKSNELHHFVKRFQIAAARPTRGPTAADVAAWRSIIDRLRSDPLAEPALAQS